MLFQIKQETMLEDVNGLLNAGEVPGLYDVEEKAEICEKMRAFDRYINICYLLQLKK